MKLSETQSLPSVGSETWHRVWHEYETLFKDLFGIEGSWCCDVEGAAAVCDDRLRFEEKLSLARDGGRFHASVVSLEFDGNPFAVFTRDGKRGEIGPILVTDRRVLGQATAHLNAWRKLGDDVAFAEDDPTTDVEIAIGGGTVVSDRGRTMLVQADHASEAGELLVREDDVFAAVRSALAADASLSPAFLKEGLSSPHVRAVVAEAIVSAVPDGIDKVLVDEYDESGRSATWTAAAVVGREGTYALVVDGWALRSGGFAGLNGIRAERVGGPEAIEEYRPDPSSPRP